LTDKLYKSSNFEAGECVSLCCREVEGGGLCWLVCDGNDCPVHGPLPPPSLHGSITVTGVDRDRGLITLESLG
jgi:hypothetical protein